MKKIIFVLCLFMAITTFSTLTHARDSNGVEVTDTYNALGYGLDIDHFSAFNPTSASYIYNEAGGQTAISGSVNMAGHIGPKTLAVSVPTLGSTSIDFRLEYQVSTSMSTWVTAYEFNVAAATTEDIGIPITEYMKAYRLGVKVNTNGTDVINCSTTAISYR